MSTNNQTGKLKVTCSCGTKAALDSYDIPSWQQRHASLNPNVKHDLTVSPDPIGVGEVW